MMLSDTNKLEIEIDKTSTSTSTKINKTRSKRFFNNHNKNRLISCNRNHCSNLVVIIILANVLMLNLIEVVHGQRVSFYEHFKRKGKSLQLSIRQNSCTKLPTKWQQQASSIDTHGSCLIFYEYSDCTGKSMRLHPGLTTYVSNLKKVRFNDIISSAQPCKFKITLPGGRYAIQNIDDKKYLSARTHFRRGYTMVDTEPWRNRISQQWDVERNTDGTYWLIPRIHVSKNPITYNLKKFKKSLYPEVGMHPERMYWTIEHLKGNKYLVINDETSNCLVMDDEIEEDECDPKLESHQWAFYKLTS